MEPLQNCFICEKTLSNSETVCVTKGLFNLIKVSKARKDGNHVQLGTVDSITVHKLCRREYIKERNIKRCVKELASTSKDEKTFRTLEKFDFLQNCMFCGEECNVSAERKKNINRQEVVNEVRTLTLKDKVLQHCAQRKDELSEVVARRVNSVLCLVAAEARYHKECYAKFLTNSPSTHRRGRPQDDEIWKEFEKLCEYIDNSDECQFTLLELLRKVQENLGSSTMSIKTLQKKLMEEYGDGVVLATARKRPTVVCFRGSGLKLINSWYNERASNEKDERMRIVNAAATIIREGIRTSAYNNTE